MAHWLIVGASRGIGLELARQLAAQGEKVTASVRGAAPLEALLSALAPIGADAQVVRFDTRDGAAIASAARQVAAPIDILVANAGAYGPMRQASTDMDFDGALDLLSINTLGPLTLRIDGLSLHVEGHKSDAGDSDKVSRALDLAGRRARGRSWGTVRHKVGKDRGVQPTGKGGLGGLALGPIGGRGPL